MAQSLYVQARSWKKGVRDGHGRLNYAGSTADMPVYYEGDWLQGKKHGHGKQVNFQKIANFELAVVLCKISKLLFSRPGVRGLNRQS